MAEDTSPVRKGTFSGNDAEAFGSTSMTDDELLYESWRVPGSYFNRMLDCGDRHNQWVQNALEYLPRDVLDEHKGRLAFIAMAQRDGIRLARVLCETREVIILAEHILPKARAHEGHPEVRYFIYVVLHEIAHAIKRHRSPLYDSLTCQQIEDQEAEADTLALTWFNDHIEGLANPDLPPLTCEEVDEAKSKSRTLMKELHAG
jgi:hypothetical protein